MKPNLIGHVSMAAETFDQLIQALATEAFSSIDERSKPEMINFVSDMLEEADERKIYQKPNQPTGDARYDVLLYDTLEKYRINYEQEHLDEQRGYEKEFFDYLLNVQRELPGSQDFKRPWNHTLSPFVQLRPNQIKLKQWQYRVWVQLNKESPQQYLSRQLKWFRSEQKNKEEEATKDGKFDETNNSMDASRYSIMSTMIHSSVPSMASAASGVSGASETGDFSPFPSMDIDASGISGASHASGASGIGLSAIDPRLREAAIGNSQRRRSALAPATRRSTVGKNKGGMNRMGSQQRGSLKLPNIGSNRESQFSQVSLAVPSLKKDNTSGNSMQQMKKQIEQQLLLDNLDKLNGLNEHSVHSLPQIKYDTWLAKEVIDGFLYWGDHIDALNFGYCFDNKIEYIINCSAGHCNYGLKTEYEKAFLLMYKVTHQKNRQAREKERQQRFELKKYEIRQKYMTLKNLRRLKKQRQKDNKRNEILKEERNKAKQWKICHLKQKEFVRLWYDYKQKEKEMNRRYAISCSMAARDLNKNLTRQASIALDNAIVELVKEVYGKEISLNDGEIVNDKKEDETLEDMWNDSNDEIEKKKREQEMIEDAKVKIRERSYFVRRLGIFNEEKGFDNKFMTKAFLQTLKSIENETQLKAIKFSSFYDIELPPGYNIPNKIEDMADSDVIELISDIDSDDARLRSGLDSDDDSEIEERKMKGEMKDLALSQAKKETTLIVSDEDYYDDSDDAAVTTKGKSKNKLISNLTINTNHENDNNNDGNMNNNESDCPSEYFDEIKCDYDLDCGKKDSYYYPRQYDSDYGLFDSEIIENKFPFKFLNLYCNNWQSYPILNLHLEEVVNFIEKAKQNNKKVLIFDTKMNVTRQELMQHQMEHNNGNSNNFDTLKLLCGENLTPSWFFNKVKEHCIKYETRMQEKHEKRMQLSQKKYDKRVRKNSAIVLRGLPEESMAQLSRLDTKSNLYTPMSVVEVDDIAIGNDGNPTYLSATNMNNMNNNHNDNSHNQNQNRFFTERNYKSLGIGGENMFDTPSQVLLKRRENEGLNKAMYGGHTLLEKYEKYLKPDQLNIYNSEVGGGNNLLFLNMSKMGNADNNLISKLKDRRQEFGRSPSPNPPSDDNKHIEVSFSTGNKRNGKKEDGEQLGDVVSGRSMIKTKGDEAFWADWDNLLVSIFDEATCINRKFAQSYDRSGALLCGYLIRKGIFFKRAFDLLRLHRKNVLLNSGFVKQLIELDYIINEKRTQTQFLDYRYKMDLTDSTGMKLTFDDENRFENLKFSLIERPKRKEKMKKTKVGGKRKVAMNGNNNNGNNNMNGDLSKKEDESTYDGLKHMKRKNTNKRKNKSKKKRKKRFGRSNTKKSFRTGWGDDEHNAQTDDSGISTDESFGHSSSGSEVDLTTSADGHQVLSWKPKATTPRASQFVATLTSPTKPQRPSSARAYKSDHESDIFLSVGNTKEKSFRVSVNMSPEKKRPATTSSNHSNRSFDFAHDADTGTHQSTVSMLLAAP